MLIFTLPMARGILTKPSVSPSIMPNLSAVSDVMIMYATPASVILIFSYRSQPIILRRFSLYSLKSFWRMPSLSTPAPRRPEAMAKVEGYTEFEKLLVSVVIPAINASADG